MEQIKNLMDMQNRTALITGAGGHLGRAISLALAELNCNLILVDKNGSSLDETKIGITKFDTHIDTFCVDLENPSERENLFKTIVENFEVLNCLINNAAFVGDKSLDGGTSLENQSVETWRRAFEVNLTSVFEISKSLAPLIGKSQNGNIINVASIYGQLGLDLSLYKNTEMGNPAAYAASKGINTIDALAFDDFGSKIRVNAIAPGGILRKQPQQFIKRYSNRTFEPNGCEEDFRCDGLSCQ